MADPLIAAVGNQSGVVVLRHNNKDYKVNALTDNMRAQYLSWVHSFIIRETEKLRVHYSPKAFREIRNDLAKDIASGEYGMGTANYQTIAETPEGSFEFVRVVVKDPNLTDDEVKDFLLAKGEEFNAALKALNPVPEELQEAGEPEDPKATTPPKPTSP